jgi:ABC-type sugar transport system ATPase subunit
VVTPLLRAESLQRTYARRMVLDLDVLELQPGEVLAVVGPNGAGKSTLFRILLQLERPDRGAVFIDGVRMSPRDDATRRRMAGIFQRAILFSGTVRDNIGFGLRARGVPAADTRQRVHAAAEALSLVTLLDASVHRLSGGEAQRVALARALVTQPDVLLLDEPMANLDVSARRRLRQDIEHVARQHARGIIMITHDPADAFGLADRVLVMQDGRAVQYGTPDDILLQPRSPFVAELGGAELLLHGRVEQLDGDLVAVRVEGDALLWAAWSSADPPANGDAAVVAYRPEDVVVAAHGAAMELSAVNRIDVTVDMLVPAGAVVRARLRYGAGASLNAVLTRRSVEALGLAPEVAATAHMKATALHAWRRESHS